MTISDFDLAPPIAYMAFSPGTCCVGHSVFSPASTQPDTWTSYGKKSQDHVRILGFYRPSYTRPILTPEIRICSQKWSQVYISIDYGNISQVKMLYKVKFSKLEICQSDCRFIILGKNYKKKVFFFFRNFEWNIVRISVNHPK